MLSIREVSIECDQDIRIVLIQNTILGVKVLNPSGVLLYYIFTRVFTQVAFKFPQRGNIEHAWEFLELWGIFSAVLFLWIFARILIAQLGWTSRTWGSCNEGIEESRIVTRVRGEYLIFL